MIKNNMQQLPLRLWNKKANLQEILSANDSRNEEDDERSSITQQKLPWSSSVHGSGNASVPRSGRISGAGSAAHDSGGSPTGAYQT